MNRVAQATIAMNSFTNPCRGCCLHDRNGSERDSDVIHGTLRQQVVHGNENSPPLTPAEVDSAHQGFTLFREMPAASSYGERNPPSAALSLANYTPSSLLVARRVRQRIKFTHCVFCKNNGENEDFYMSHTVKDDYDRVTCPVLSAYRCPICGATGPEAHTLKYCPKNKERQLFDQLAPFMHQPRRVLACEARPILKAPGGPVYADGGYATGSGSVGGDTPPPTPFGSHEFDSKFQVDFSVGYLESASVLGEPARLRGQF